MRFSPTFLDEIRDRVPISNVVGRRVTWDRKKTNAARGDYWACCPFHGEKTPSFHCEDRKGRYHCFGCGVSGDHFRFLTDLDGLSFPEAVEQIADMAGVAMPRPDPESERRERQRATLVDVMEMATQFFEQSLQSAVGAKARAYLRDRGLSGRSIEAFRLGYAPDSRNALKEFLAGKGVEKEQIEACGLVIHENVPVSYDRFRDRVMFPILSSRDKVIAFGGRALSADAMAKYLNSNETELFRKGEVLYNFARARRSLQGAAGEGSAVIAVEGYMDVIALAQAGIDHVVAPLGTALTAMQLELLWRMSPQPVLCFDGDQAGLRAASRAADLALPLIRPDRSLRFALLPEGKDPDDIVRHDGRAPFDGMVAQARSLVDLVWQRETAPGGFDTPEKRAGLEARLRQIVGVIGDENVRRFYQQDMRERLQALFAPARGPWPRQRQGGKGARQDRAGRMAGNGASTGISEQLARSGLVRGHRDMPALRESVLALAIVNHPQLLAEEYDEIAAIDFEHRDLQRLWQALLPAAFSGRQLSRDELGERLRAEGFAELLASVDGQLRKARLWIATADAAFEDAREGYRQALSLHKRGKALRYQKIELEREIAAATEAGDGSQIEPLLRALAEVQTEILRMENQEAIIDGFGVLSGRVRGVALPSG